MDIEPQIRLDYCENGFTEIFVNDVYIGKVEDPEQEFKFVLTKLFKAMNVDVVKLRDK